MTRAGCGGKVMAVEAGRCLTKNMLPSQTIFMMEEVPEFAVVMFPAALLPEVIHKVAQEVRLPISCRNRNGN